MNDISTSIKSKHGQSPVYRLFQSIKLVGFEGFIWISALVYLAFFNNPFKSHFTICPLSNAGFEHCPGCGLGNSVSFLFNGYFSESFDTHLLGIPAIIIIVYRVYSIIKFNYSKVKPTTK
jgi:hypothetical protein